jgi:uncharacterized membrane protein (DUF485 family)
MNYIEFKEKHQVFTIVMDVIRVLTCVIWIALIAFYLIK